jgi:hypothetical protein
LQKPPESTIFASKITNMKITALLAVVFLLAAPLAAGAQKARPKPAASAAFALKNGDVLVYEVTANGSTYHFEVTVKEIREAIVFDWIMPEKDVSGEVTLEKAARDGATVYKNMFRDGEEWVLTDSSTVWMSRKNFNELKKGNTIMTLDNNGAERFDKKEGGTLDIIYKGKPMKLKNFICTNGKEDANKRQLWILDNTAQPLILKMDIGFSIVLKEVKEG